MGTLKGHLIPGMEFILLGLFLNLIHKAEQLAEATLGTSSNVHYSSVGVSDEDMFDKDAEQGVKEKADIANPKTARIKLLFSLYALLSISLGVLYEGFGGIVMKKEGGFFAELGHLTMYVSFLPAGFAFGLESGLLFGAKEKHVESAPLLSQSAMGMAFFIQYMLLEGHSKMKKPGADFLFHKLWADSAFFLFVVYATSVVAKLAKFERLARVAQLACPAALFIQGVWVCLTGWILFGGEFRVMRNGDMDMEKIMSLFGITIVISCVAQYVWIELVPASVAKCYQSRINH